MEEIRAYSISWVDCYCENHKELMLLQTALPLTTAKEAVEREIQSRKDYLYTLKVESQTYEKIKNITI